jgi:cell division septal protein FtsQ
VATAPPPRTRAGTAAQRPVTRAEPGRAARPAPAPNRAAPAPARGQSRKRARGARRFLLFLLVVILFVAAVAVAITLAASTSSSVVHFKTVVAHDAQSAINTVQNLINQYTK